MDKTDHLNVLLREERHLSNKHWKQYGGTSKQQDLKLKRELVKSAEHILPHLIQIEESVAVEHINNYSDAFIKALDHVLVEDGFTGYFDQNSITDYLSNKADSLWECDEDSYEYYHFN